MVPSNGVIWVVGKLSWVLSRGAPECGAYPGGKGIATSGESHARETLMLEKPSFQVWEIERRSRKRENRFWKGMMKSGVLNHDCTLSSLESCNKQWSLELLQDRALKNLPGEADVQSGLRNTKPIWSC